MKHFFFFLLLSSFSLFSSGFAFFSSPDFVRESLSLKFFVEKNVVRVEWIEKIKNTSSESKMITFWMPVVLDARDFSFFVDMQAQPFFLLRDQDRLTEVFGGVESKQDVRFFRLADVQFPVLFKSQPFSVASQGIASLKFSFSFPLIEKDSFFGFSFFSHEDIVSPLTEISFSLQANSKIHHFFSSFSERASFHKTEASLSFFEFFAHQKLSDSLFFLWSFAPQPELFFSDGQDLFIAHFLSLPARSFEEIVFLIDASGSMYAESWRKLEEVFHEIFSWLPESVKVKVVFFQDSVFFLQDSFVPANFAFRKSFFEKLSSTVPLGVSRFDLAWNAVSVGWSADFSKRAIFLFTDEEVPPAFFTAPAPVFVFHFDALKSSVWKTFAELSGGFLQSLFRASPSFVEKETFFSRFFSSASFVSSSSLLPKYGEGDLLPRQFESVFSAQSPFFLGRVLNGEKKQSFPFLSFFPRVWAERKIARLLWNRSGIPEESLLAVLALSRTYGSFVFDEVLFFSSLPVFQKKLSSLSAADFYSFLLDLKKTFFVDSHSRVSFFDGEPFYFVDSVWTAFSFFDQGSHRKTISIRPFSLAQKELFFRFPDLFSIPFGMGNAVSFCPGRRCVKVSSAGKTEISKEELLFFRDVSFVHWGELYLEKALQKDFLSMDREGRVYFEIPVSREEFSFWIWKHLFFAENPQNPEIVFSDVVGSPFALALDFLQEKNIVSGYPDGTFRPQNNLTRAEGVKILLASLGVQELSSVHDPFFSDATGWEFFWVHEARKRGIVQGISPNRFDPHVPLTRVQALKILFEARP